MLDALRLLLDAVCALATFVVLIAALVLPALAELPPPVSIFAGTVSCIVTWRLTRSIGRRALAFGYDAIFARVGSALGGVSAGGASVALPAFGAPKVPTPVQALPVYVAPVRPPPREGDLDAEDFDD